MRKPHDKGIRIKHQPSKNYIRAQKCNCFLKQHYKNKSIENVIFSENTDNISDL